MSRHVISEEEAKKLYEERFTVLIAAGDGKTLHAVVTRDGLLYRFALHDELMSLYSSLQSAIKSYNLL